MRGLGFIPDVYFNEPLIALSTPGGPGPLGGCVACAGVRPESLGLVMVDESALSGVGFGASDVAIGMLGLVLGAVTGIGVGAVALRMRRRRRGR